MDILVQRALDGATVGLETAAWAIGAAGAFTAAALAVAAAVYGPITAWRWASYRLHVHHVSTRLRSEV